MSDTTEKTCKQCGAPLLIKAVPRDPSKENEAAQDMVAACSNCGTRNYDDVFQGCQHKVPPWFTSGSADKPIDSTLNGYPCDEVSIRADERRKVINAVLSMGIIYKCKPLKRDDITAIIEKVKP